MKTRKKGRVVGKVVPLTFREEGEVICLLKQL